MRKTILATVMAVALMLAGLGTTPAQADPDETVEGMQVIRGKVTANGKPVNGGMVIADGGKSGGYHMADIVKGSYALLVEVGASFTVYAEPDSTEPLTWLTTYAGSTVRSVDTKKQKVGKDKPVTLDIAVYDKVGSISGKVLDAKGKPAKRVNVYAHGRSRPGSAETRTDSKGRYTLTGLPKGKYSVTAIKGESYDTMTEKSAKVEARTNTKLDLALKKPSTHKGKIVLTIKAPSSLVKEGSVCAGLMDAKGDQVDGDCLKGKGKTLTFRKLPAGSYKIMLSGVNGSKKVVVKKNKTTKVTVTRPKGTSISGKLTDHKGKPVANAFVSAMGSNGFAIGDVETDSKGRYKISGVTRDSYVVSATMTTDTMAAEASKKVTIKGKKATVNLTFPKPGGITGKIVNSKGEPVAGIGVAASGNGASYGITNSKGVYKLTGIGSGEFWVSTHDDYDGGYYDATIGPLKAKAGKKYSVPTITVKG